MKTDVAPVAVAQLVANVAASIDGVAHLDGGAMGGYATYGDGTRVKGVKVEGSPATAVGVQVVAIMGRPLTDIGDAIRTEVTEELTRQLPELDQPALDIHITDVVGSGDVDDDAPTPGRRQLL